MNLDAIEIESAPGRAPADQPARPGGGRNDFVPVAHELDLAAVVPGPVRVPARTADAARR
jgi:hypothetical protein